MIVGNGLIASAFQQFDREDVIFFASGVSNSLETQKSEFEREKNLILKTIKEYPNALFVYFSTCSIYDSSKSNSPYVNHKLEMEQIIEKLPKYLIFRVSNAVGKGGNPNTLLNFLVESIKTKTPITIYTNATRNFISIYDIQSIVLKSIKSGRRNSIINVAYPDNFLIEEIVQEIEQFLNITANKKYKEEGIDYSIDISNIQHTHHFIPKKEYIRNLLEKYYQLTKTV